MNPSCESALVILIPEADALVESFRKQYDPSAPLGLPAHVTLLYPFKPPGELTADVIRKLEDLFSRTPQFTISFSEVRRFINVLYLAPIPDEPFRQLTELVRKHFPETPPYGGQFAEIVPHLTVAQVSDEEELQRIADAFQQAAQGKLPILSNITEILLMDNEHCDWQVRIRFQLSAISKIKGSRDSDSS